MHKTHFKSIKWITESDYRKVEGYREIKQEEEKENKTCKKKNLSPPYPLNELFQVQLPACRTKRFMSND